MAFHVGQKVVCVNASSRRRHVNMPIKGRVYTIRWIGQRPTDSGVGIMLEGHYGGEFSNGIEYCFCPTRFRPVVERKTDISVFTAMLNPSKKTERV